MRPEDPPEEVLRKVLRSEVQALEEALSALEAAPFAQAVELLLKARRVGVFGVGSSAPVALDAYYRFLRIGLPVFMAPETHMQAVAASLMGPEEVGFFVSHTGRSRELLDSVREAHRAGGKDPRPHLLPPKSPGPEGHCGPHRPGAGGGLPGRGHGHPGGPPGGGGRPLRGPGSAETRCGLVPGTLPGSDRRPEGFPEVPVKKPLLLGHRGAPRRARENTLESVRLALEAGLSGVELDVQATREGRLVVRHDLTTPRGPVPALSLAELRSMEPWVPTLEEVLELFQDYPEAVLNAELKFLPGFPSAARALGWALTPLASRALVSSFDPVALYLLRDSGLPRALLFAEEDLGPVARALGHEGVHPHKDLGSEESLARWKEAGFFVIPWTVNDPGEARRLLGIGVDGLIGDLPEVLLAARG